ncbi:sensor histidine kinase [Diplocloster modestus]|uniref:histidine kinase n=1 Tax=Diplocloster modestus TaxID=2850322 RepID=A0ABS6K7X1_9FIRM|nr:HAMP domain-containing sensor histidine kinase [Diplocloster modestus]MBU9726608.1 HAMP domain-containing histidine kinase [Diplocloster modestus]
MKFSWKIFLTTILIVCCTFSIGGMILMSSWLQQFLDREIQFAESQNVMLNGALQTASRLLPREDYRDIHAVVERVLSSVLDKNREQLPVLVTDGEDRTVFQTPAFTAYDSVFLNVSGQQSGYVILSEDGAYRIHYLSHWKLGSEIYGLETVRDITEVFETRDAQYGLFIRLTLGMTCITGVLVLLLSKWLTKPIRSLSRAARKMAEGDYGVRARGKGQDEVGMLAEDFNRMAEALEHKMEQLKQALRRQEEFSGSFAHEVKTPLTSIMGYADMLRSRELPQEIRLRAADTIFRESRRLETLSFKLLDLMVLKNRELAVERVSAKAFLEEVSSFIRPSFDRQIIRLLTEIEDAPIRIDVVLFRTLLLNLLENARQAFGESGTVLSDDGYAVGETGMAVPDNGCAGGEYGKTMPECGQAGVEDRVVRLVGHSDHGQYRITVSDSGKGIRPEELSRITEAFYRVDKARDRASGGAGLGLAICSLIVEAHRGTMSFCSEAGRGTDVTVSIGGVTDEE